MTLLRVMCVLLILSGIGGVAAGESSAVGGWWLIVIFGAILLLTSLRARTPRSPDGPPVRLLGMRPVTVAAVTLAILVIVPVAFVMLAGGA